MMFGLSLRVSWICLLLSSCTCFPATKEDFMATWDSSAEEDSDDPLVFLQSDEPATVQNPRAAGQWGHSPTGSGTLSGAGAPGVAAGLSHVGFVSPPTFDPKPVGPTYPTGPIMPPMIAVDPPYPVGPGFHPMPVGPISPPIFVVDPPYTPGAGSAGRPYPGGSGVPSNWLPPDFSVLGGSGGSAGGHSSGKMSKTPQKVSEPAPLPPASSYIIQSSNGYGRAREILSHTEYEPDYPEPMYFLKPVQAPTKTKTPRKSVKA